MRIIIPTLCALLAYGPMTRSGALFGQRQTDGPLLYTVAIHESSECAQPCLVIEASLKNISSQPLAIGTRALRYEMSVSTNTRRASGNIMGESRFQMPSSHPIGSYDDVNYRVLKAGDIYRTTFGLSLDNAFYKRNGKYRIRFTYGQFRGDYSFQGVTLFKGTADSNELRFTNRVVNAQVQGKR